MICTRCGGTGFLNLEQIPEERRIYLDSPEAISEWMNSHDGHDVQVCDCCGDGDEHYGEPGQHKQEYDPLLGAVGRIGVSWDCGGVPQCI